MHEKQFVYLVYLVLSNRTSIPLNAAIFNAENISSSGIKYGEAIQTDSLADVIIAKKIFLITLYSLSGPPAIN